MPKVGNAEFPYTKHGISQAKAWSAMTDKPMQMKKNYQRGGLASMGRMGDTAIRNVAGRPSHVNPIEAGMIDKYGRAGQQFAQRTGSGTINPKTGLPEYSWASNWWNKNVKPKEKELHYMG